jgi:LysM repeat protein
MIKLLVLIGWTFAHSPADSIGREIINGKVHVIHKVDEKETLYSISRRYGTTVDAIIQQNPTADGGLEVGQILKVPYVSSPKKAGNSGKHTVAEKETLFSIAKLYGLSVDELKQLNQLTSNSLSIGQELIVKKSGPPIETPAQRTAPDAIKSVKGVHTVVAKETLYSISKQYNISVDQLKKWNNLEGNELKLGQVLLVAAPANQNPVLVTKPVETTPVPETKPEEIVTEKTTVEKPASIPIKISEGYKDGKEVKETGLAELIEGTQGNRKYLALHRTASTGTILKIKNEMNDREVFVRVIGKLPDIAQNDKLIIKISKSAYDRLGAIDPKFMVEVTWYK